MSVLAQDPGRLGVPNFSEWGAEDWSAAAACLTAVVAVAAALFAFFQVREARTLRRDQARPFVVVDIQPSGSTRHILNLVVENIGSTMARDVTFEFEPPLTTTLANYDLGSTTFIKVGLPMVPPGRRHEYLFDQTAERRDAGLPMRFDVTVRYSDQRGNKEEPLRFPIDLTPYYGMRYTRQDGLHEVATSLKAIADTSRAWTRTNGGGVRVWTRSEDAERQRERIEWELLGEPPGFGVKPPPDVLVWMMRFPPARALLGALLTRMRKRDAR